MAAVPGALDQHFGVGRGEVDAQATVGAERVREALQHARLTGDRLEAHGVHSPQDHLVTRDLEDGGDGDQPRDRVGHCG